MIYKVFTVYDSKALAYMQPFFSPSVGEAERLFKELCNDEKHNFNKYAEDFTLFYLGDFDNLKAQFLPLTAPISVCLALACINPKE